MKANKDWQAQWIWITGEDSPQNIQVCFRRTFKVPGNLQRAQIRLTADSRYRLWVNGTIVSQGPVRSWPWELSYDTHDITDLLQPGRENVVAVLVSHVGRATFQYIHGRGGLLAEIMLTGATGKETVLASGKSWRATPHTGYARNTPRITCQQTWVEQFDACSPQDSWTAVDFDDSRWPAARVIGPVGMPPWKKLVPRDIPQLTLEPLYPVRIEAVEAVKAPMASANFNVIGSFAPQHKSSNPFQIEGFVVTVLRCSKAVPEVVLSRFHNTVSAALNGQRVEDAAAPVGQTDCNAAVHPQQAQAGNCSLRKGDNLLVLDVTRGGHDWNCGLSLKGGDAQVQFCWPPGPAGCMAAMVEAPREDQELRARVQACRNLADLQALGLSLKPMAEVDCCPWDLYALCSQQQAIPGRPVKLRDRQALLSAAHEDCVLEPVAGGADVRLRLDFGKMTIGFIEFELEAEAGVVIDLLGFETKQDGEIIYPHGMQNGMRYTTRAGFQTYRALVRRGFQWLEMTFRGLQAPVRLRAVRTLQNTFPVERRGQFLCSDRDLNAIWEMGAYTARLCMEDTYVDCPTYEQTFWVGDARNEALINYAAFGDTQLTRRCWELVPGSLRHSPLTEDQVPSGWNDIIPAWHFLWILACEEFYQYTGDQGFLRRIYPALAKSAQNLQEHVNAQGQFIIRAWSLMDWAPMDTPGDGVITHQNCWAVLSLERTARLAEALGNRTDARQWRKLAERIRTAINRDLWDEQRQAYIDCIGPDGTRSSVVSQQTNTVALLCDCISPERCEVVVQQLLDVPADWVAAGSPFFMFFVFEALAKLGEHQRILDLTRDRWGFMLDKGASTCWEVFPTPGQHVWSRSHCHAWSAAPTYFLSAWQLGIRPLEPGFGRALIAPVPCDLGWARGRCPTPHGEIEVWWQQTNPGFQLEVALPEHISARIVLPVGSRQCRQVSVPQAWGTSAREEDGQWVIEARAGARGVISAR